MREKSLIVFRKLKESTRFKSSSFSFEFVGMFMLESPQITICSDDLFAISLSKISISFMKIQKSDLGTRYRQIITTRVSYNVSAVSSIIFSTQIFSYLFKCKDFIPFLTLMQVPPGALLPV